MKRYYYFIIIQKKTTKLDFGLYQKIKSLIFSFLQYYTQCFVGFFFQLVTIGSFYNYLYKIAQSNNNQNLYCSQGFSTSKTDCFIKIEMLLQFIEIKCITQIFSAHCSPFILYNIFMLSDIFHLSHIII